MTYVRDRAAPASKEHARRRAEMNRRALVPDPANPGARFTGALDWFRAAAAYAGRRSYRTLGIGEAAIARRDQLTAEAARLLQEAGCEIDALVPVSFRRSTRRAGFRDAWSHAATPRDQLHAAYAWLLFAVRRAERYSAAAGRASAEIKDRAAARLIEWAEEIDSDDYGE